MFYHNLKYSIKILLKNKVLIFWTFAFPIILGTFFHMAFSNLVSSEKLDIIDIAIVDNEQFKENEIFKNAFDELSNEENKERLFNTQYVSMDTAKKMLEDEKIVGYMYLEDNKPKIVINKNGIDETVFKYVTEEISETSIIMNTIIDEKIKNINTIDNTIDYEKIYNDVLEMVNNDNTNIKNIASNNLDFSLIEFYTLIAMACLYGGMLSMTAINHNLANMSNKGKRISVSPTKKSTVIISSLFASYIVELIGLALLFLYTIFVLKVDYGNHVGLVILLAGIGSLSGLSLGLIIGSLFKKSEGAKIGVFIAITMLCCFFSGMMGITLKYVIDKNIPIINKINPASMITDGFYSLYYYNTFNRYWFDVISLLIFSFILIFISVIGLRRQKYDSI